MLTYTTRSSEKALRCFSSRPRHWSGAPWELHQVPEFSRDHQVIVYDQRGTGNSPTRSTDFSAGCLAADVIALLDHLGVDRAIICGHSYGGAVAQLMAVEYKERLEKLILASSGAPSYASRGVPIKMCVQMVENGYDRYYREQPFEGGFTKSFYATHRDKVEAFLDLRHANRPSLETYLGYVVARQEVDITSRLPDICIPTLVMVGDHEGHRESSTTNFVATAKLLASSIPNAKLVILPDSGHYYPFLSPEMTNRIMRDFLVGT